MYLCLEKQTLNQVMTMMIMIYCTQSAFTCSKLTIETLEQGVNNEQ